MNKNKKSHPLISVTTWLVIIAFWTISTNTGMVSSQLLPSPQQVFKAFIMILSEGYNSIPFWEHLGISFYRLFLAVILALVMAIPLGLLSGYFSKFRAVIDSLVSFYRPLPPLAYYMLLILWLGIDEESKVTLLFLASFAPIYIACSSAVSRVDETFVLSAKSMGATNAQVFFTIVVPATLPDIFIGVRTAVGVAYTTLVSAEMVAATSGLGWMVIDASRYLKSDVMFVGIIIMGLTGILIDFLLKKLETKIVFWAGK
ncbi:ABC transporter permease [Erysipelothrix urinaevulpis]|uniref:ABC transporter permease n=1 Tax=Erysipelothrix urinaevulpis TaxID=2683717 RepID=UPI00135C3706|nr:ABC transporter permease [Erysipelothrix urinaevulpis]